MERHDSPVALGSAFDLNQGGQKSDYLIALTRAYPADDELSTVTDMPNQLGGERHDAGSCHIRHHHVEGPVDLFETCICRLDLVVLSIERRIPARCRNCFWLHINANCTPSTEGNRGERDDAASTSHIEQAFATTEVLDQVLDDHSGRWMMPAAESSGAQLDQIRKAGAIVLGPGQTDTEPVTEPDRGSAALPCNEARSRSWPRDCHQAALAQQHRYSFRGLSIGHLGQNHTAITAG